MAADEAAAATHNCTHTGRLFLSYRGPFAISTLRTHAWWSQQVVKKILALEFVEMSELRADVWPEDPTPAEAPSTCRRPSSRLRRGWSASPGWRQCWCPGSLRRVRSCGRTSQPSSTRPTATRGRRGSRMTVSSGGKFGSEGPNWSVPNSRLYNEAFTGHAKIMQRCQYCLSEDHGSTGCPQHPNPMSPGAWGKRRVGCNRVGSVSLTV